MPTGASTPVVLPGLPYLTEARMREILREEIAALEQRLQERRPARRRKAKR